MKNDISKTEARELTETFFSKKDFTPEEVRKIKRLAMKFNIKLSGHRKKFCKKCLAKLNGKIRVRKGYKIVECENCGYRNKFKMTRKD